MSFTIDVTFALYIFLFLFHVLSWCCFNITGKFIIAIHQYNICMIPFQCSLLFMIEYCKYSIKYMTKCLMAKTYESQIMSDSVLLLNRVLNHWLNLHFKRFNTDVFHICYGSASPWCRKYYLLLVDHQYLDSITHVICISLRLVSCICIRVYVSFRHD